MGLLTILKKVKQKEREVRILMLGLDNAGKTTVVKKFNGEDIDLISPTLGFNIKTLEYRGFKLNIWDVGGQTSLRSYWRNYFEQTDGLIWVVDSADRMRLRDCKAELQALLQQEVRGPQRPACHAKLTQRMRSQRLAGASLLVFANKQDIEGALSGEQIREASPAPRPPPRLPPERSHAAHAGRRSSSLISFARSVIGGYARAAPSPAAAWR